MSFHILIDVIGIKMKHRDLAKLIIERKAKVVEKEVLSLKQFALTLVDIIEYIQGKEIPMQMFVKYEQCIAEIANIDENIFSPLHVFQVTHDTHIVSEEEAKDYLEHPEKAKFEDDLVVLGLECNSYDISSPASMLIESSVTHYLSAISNIGFEATKRLSEIGAEYESVSIYRVQDCCRCCINKK